MVEGLVVVTSPSDVRHEGITIDIEGVVSLQLSNKNVGMFETFRNSIKPIVLLELYLDIQTGGKIPAGCTEFPFMFPLMNQPRRNVWQTHLLETYHGVFVSVIYNIKCMMKRSFLNKDLNATCQFIVQCKKVCILHLSKVTRRPSQKRWPLSKNLAFQITIFLAIAKICTLSSSNKIIDYF